MPRTLARPALLALSLVLALGAGACSTKPTDAEGGLGGAGGSGLAGRGGAGVGTPGSREHFASTVGDRVFFETDSSDLTAKSVATLDAQARYLAQYPRASFTVEGHADERGTREYNFALGARRAQTVRDYLASRGVEASRMRTTSFGKERPVAVCDDISCWSQNRRAVTALGAGAAGT